MERNTVNRVTKKSPQLIYKLVLICLMAVSAFFIMSQAADAKTAGWKKIYKKFLKKHSLDFNVITYIPLDKNKTPELVTYDGKIYTIKKGRVKRIKGKAYPQKYWKKGNCFFYVDGDAEGCETHTFYAIKNGKVSVVKVFDYHSGRAGGTEGWEIDGNEVTESQFNTKLARFKKRLTKKYGKPKRIKYRDYTRYHFYNKQTRRYEAETNYAKVKIKGKYLYVIGQMESGLGTGGNKRYIPGKKHIFKLTSKTRYISGDAVISKKKMIKIMKRKGLWIIIDTRKGKVKDFIIVG